MSPAPRAALLFDLDGTMLHTDPIHFAIYRELMAARGIAIDQAFYDRHVLGRLNSDVFREFLPDEADPHGLSDIKEAEFRRRLPRPFPATRGLGRLLDRAENAGLGLAVVTNANPLNAEAMLAAIGLRDRFAVVISGETCARGKPFPDPYLSAMDRLGVAPADCIAFEDSPSGIRSASDAGAFVIGLRSTLDDAGLRAAGARLTLADFTDPALEDALTRLEGVSS
ncbi:HAD family hydrolase [Pararhodobacter aggregans]|uniref:CbbY/CbbZ/GpH/YieH n=1 Tax=Pararhodobacter aggregans TaxID=404875 RepID=A0A2T7UU50_9RHOB|nr:HAD-IA family hydrolase [Pararhodobacter aggregans]PTX04253.1 HAD superfamily hydrolase (TIGR01509 family) [Pararhodobacter aggregans]PVE48303.1 CbbY/CbbZ/GpH/YieH [Pararhodobacter aggregans]